MKKNYLKSFSKYSVNEGVTDFWSKIKAAVKNYYKFGSDQQEMIDKLVNILEETSKYTDNVRVTKFGLEVPMRNEEKDGFIKLDKFEYSITMPMGSKVYLDKTHFNQIYSKIILNSHTRAN